jgi:pimeloyl-ACP methyl ester carboxylesterase
VKFLRISRRRIFRLAAGLLVLLAAGLHGVGCLMLPKDDRLQGVARPFTLRTNGFSVRYHLAESGNAVRNLVFIHGTPANAGIWYEQFAPPFPRANLIAYDRPGFGLSRPMRHDPHLEEQVAALTNLLAALPRHPTVLVGHSYGGPVALLAAVEHPELVAGVVLIGGSVDPAQEHPLLVQSLFHTRATSWLLPRWLRQCNRELLTLKGDLLRLERELPQLRVPVVMLQGERDRQVPAANVAYLQSRLAALGRADLVTARVFPDYTHFIPWEHPDAVTQAVALVLARLEEPAKSRPAAPPM